MTSSVPDPHPFSPPTVGDPYCGICNLPKQNRVHEEDITLLPKRNQVHPRQCPECEVGEMTLDDHEWICGGCGFGEAED